MPGALIVETERLWLREFVEEDTPAFLRIMSDPLVTHSTGDGGVITLEQAREVLLSRPIADYQKHGFGRWACVLKKSGEVIGFAGLKYLDELKEVDIGYRLLPGYWGFGLATEAARAAIAHGFARLGLQMIIGLVLPDNVASVRVLEKCGLMFTGMIEFQAETVARYVISNSSLPCPRDCAIIGTE
jgi:RimJ/RimL family protein N-acetyltransferase